MSQVGARGRIGYTSILFVLAGFAMVAIVLTVVSWWRERARGPS